MEENTTQFPDQTNDNDRVVQVNIEEQMKTAYIDYSMSVIVGRALPDVRDGFKPVHRRVLYAMNELSNNSGKPYKKSARIVGEVMGKYHPHGDSAIYDTLVRMAQDFTMRHTMVDGQGNFGTQDGDPPAAMRYTEVRLQKFAEAMLEDIEKDTVDFQSNFDDSLEEPTVLPTRIPQLLVNGSSGIAVGMATNMMPHNLSEVIDGCIAYIHNKDITIDDLLHFVKAPDFPTGGIIYGMEGVKQGLLTGRGRVVLRGKCHVETKQSGREQIIITEVPYQVGLDALTDKIGQLVNDKTIEGIAHVNNESNKREGIRIVIDLKRDAVANIIINQLYKFTELQTSFGINNVAISKGRPRIFNVKDLIVEFVDFRMDVVIRRSKFELKKAEDRAHLLEGYLKVINDKDHLDLAISIIRGSATPDEAKKSLIERSIADNWYLPDNLFDEKAKIHYLQGIGLSEKQAQAILELRLQRLTGLEREKIIEEFNDLMNTIVRLKDLLASEDLRYDLIKTELEEVKAKFGEPRKSEIQFLADEVNMLDFIKEEDVVITVSHLGYIKRTSATEYRQQKRGGRGAIGSKTREEDFVEHLFVASTHDVMMFFTEKGRCYWLNVYEIPEGEKQSKGRAIQNLIQIPPDDKIKAIIDVKDLDKKETLQNRYVVLCTKKGIIKKTDLEDFSRPRTTGINAITILEGDELLEAKLTDGNCEIMMAVKSGRAIRFNEEKVRATGRGAIGVTGIEVDETNDEVVGMICVNKNDTDKTVLVISEKGYGKRTKLTDEDGEDVYRITNRGGKGVKTINVTEKTGRLVGILDVNEKEDLIITCQSGITLRTSISTIKTAGRNTQGVILIRLDAEDAIAAISKIEETEEETTTEVNDQSENNSPENTDNLNTNIENSN
ncbi:MAG TPA: DNA gyrase subunit A [Chitinophagaceae bacterium]|nr:DNA gyrase subunit A [Chitinophagaceae bacterium]HMZ46008.1 DNA gyrase subunit A [Chitinophagaceae bacterium]HNM34376.1 DNA gyrase subunit A [Chitinophagaceae bacterium]HNN31689.1 DNA gyrase subunit A [Chitinophagaceae bacterium]